VHIGYSEDETPLGESIEAGMVPRLQEHRQGSFRAFLQFVCIYWVPIYFCFPTHFVDHPSAHVMHLIEPDFWQNDDGQNDPRNDSTQPQAIILPFILLPTR
jgi:hypothetical protein